jgi:hypothetical protein
MITRLERLPRHGAPLTRRLRRAGLLVALVLGGWGLLAGEARAEGRQVVGKIRGTVLDESKRPLSGLMVQLSSRDDNGMLRVTGTDENGRYVFRDLPAGVYEIVVGADGYARQEKTGIEVRPPFQNIVGFTLKSREMFGADDGRSEGARLFTRPRLIATGGVAELPAGVVVQGRFIDQERRGIPEVSVTFIGKDGTGVYQAFSEEDGSFRLEALPIGLYRVLVSSPGHVSLDLPSVEVEPPGGLNLSLALVDYTLNVRDRRQPIVPPERARPAPAAPAEDASGPESEPPS